MTNTLLRLGLTLAVAMLCGWLLTKLHIPAPYLLGSLLGVWAFGKLARGPIPKPQVPRWFHITVVLGLSVLIGATFNPDILHNASVWTTSVLAMLLATVLATSGGYLYLRKLRGYDPMLSLLCSLPGGQAEVIAISRDLVEKDYFVVFCHLLRVVSVFCLVPLVLAISQGSEGVANSYVATNQIPSIFELPPLTLIEFFGLALGGYYIGKWIRLPLPHLLGPLLLSAIGHISGLIEIPRILEFVILAQVTIGGAVGARLSEVSFRELSSYFFDALFTAFLIIAIYGACAFGLAHFTGIDSIKMLLAFIPGGLYEVTLLALVFGFDVAFVGFHHTIRIILIFLALPVLVKFTQRSKANKKMS